MALLFEAGPTMAGEYGEKGLTWQELQAWQSLTQARVTPWEIAAIRRLSAEYAASANAALDPKCPAPFTSPEMHEKKQANMISALSSIAKRPAKNA